MAGVAVILSKQVKPHLLAYRAISDRLLYTRIRAKPYNASFLQVYAPTSTASEDETDDFYSRLSGEIDMLPRQDVILVLGDFNAKVGQDTRSTGVGGKYGLGELNSNGEKLISFC